MKYNNPRGTKQDYRTPFSVLSAVRALLHPQIITLDAAADASNAVCLRYYTQEDDGLRRPWDTNGVTWWNPPFAHLAQWTGKAMSEATKGAISVGLVPASVGSNWWRDCVDGVAHIRLMNGRITFQGCAAPFPKDCALLIYGHPLCPPGYSVWSWR